MWIVLGLGNPGPAYACMRHNVGFMVIELIARRWSIPFESAAGLRVGRGCVADQPALLVKPQTFMNRSGEAISRLDRQPEDSVVAVYDDLDLPAGLMRVRERGGSGGHRGVASLIEHLGPEFARVRVGIGRPPSSGAVADYVLATPTEAESAALDAAVASAGDAVECILADGTAAAMNRFNGRSADEPSQFAKEK